MLTSRSEYRLILRSDNADRRLTPIGRDIGLIDDDRWQLFQTKQANIAAEQERLQTTRVKEKDAIAPQLVELTKAKIKGSITLAELLRRSGFHYADLMKFDLGSTHLTREETEGAEIEIKYAGYIQRQQKQIAHIAKQENRSLPENLDYHAIDTLSKESREKLAKVKPLTVGQATRIGGVNPAVVWILPWGLSVRKS